MERYVEKKQFKLMRERVYEDMGITCSNIDD